MVDVLFFSAIVVHYKYFIMPPSTSPSPGNVLSLIDTLSQQASEEIAEIPDVDGVIQLFLEKDPSFRTILENIQGNPDIMASLRKSFDVFRSNLIAAAGLDGDTKNVLVKAAGDRLLLFMEKFGDRIREVLDQNQAVFDVFEELFNGDEAVIEARVNALPPNQVERLYRMLTDHGDDLRRALVTRRNHLLSEALKEKGFPVVKVGWPLNINCCFTVSLTDPSRWDVRTIQEAINGIPAVLDINAALSVKKTYPASSTATIEVVPKK